MEKFFEKLLGKKPGIELFIPFVLYFVLKGRSDESFKLISTAFTCIAAALLWRVSGDVVDKPLFNSLFGAHRQPCRISTCMAALCFWLTLLLPRTPLKKGLDRSRAAAVRAISGQDVVSGGLYETAELIFHGKKAWEKQVAPFLEFSKALRMLAVLSLALCLVELCHLLFNTVSVLRKPIHELAYPCLALVALYGLSQIACLGYVWLRVVHMRELYDLTAALTISKLRVDTTTSGPIVLWRIADKLFDPCELPLLKRRVFCDNIDDALVEKLRSSYLSVVKGNADEIDTHGYATFGEAPGLVDYVVCSSSVPSKRRDAIARKLPNGDKCLIQVDAGSTAEELLRRLHAPQVVAP